MSLLDPKKTYHNLRKKGFIDSTTRSVDHKHLDFFLNDKYILSTKISHGNKDIGDHLIKQMSVQCHLDKNDFIDLAKCPLSRDEFIEKLKQMDLLD